MLYLSTFRKLIKPLGGLALIVSLLLLSGLSAACSGQKQDPRRRAAQELYEEGERLRIEETVESKRKAIEKYEEAIPLFHAVGDRAGEADSLIGLHFPLYDLGRNGEAFNHLSQALTLAQSIGDRLKEARAIHNMGKIHQVSGETQKALEYYRQALQLAQDLGDRRQQGITLHNIGQIYSSSGEVQEAINLYEQSLELTEENDRRVRRLNSLALAYKSLGKTEKALDLLNQALRLAQAGSFRQVEANTRHYIATVSMSLGEKQKALDNELQALELRRKIGDRPQEAHSLIQLGWIYNSLRQKKQALESFRQGLELIQAIKDRAGEASALAGIARVEYEDGNLSEARVQIEAALKIIESLRDKIAVHKLRTSYLASVQKHYELYIDLLMRLHKQRPSEGFDAAAIQASERARARSLLELLSERRAEIRQGVDPALLEREHSLQQQINAQAALLGGKPTDEQAAAAKLELADLTTELEEVQAQIRVNSPRYAALTQPQPLSLAEIQTEVLDSDTLLLEYALGEERSYLWAVTPTSMTSYELPRRAEIEKAARRVYEILTAPSRREKSETDAQRRARLAQAEAAYPEAAARLSQMVLGPAVRFLETKRLLIVSEGALQYVPFAALPRPLSLVIGHLSLAQKQKPQTRDQGRRTKDQIPLIVDHDIISLPSASTLAVLRRETSGRSTASKAVAVLADPVFDKDDPRISPTAGSTESGNDTQTREESPPPIPTDLQTAFRDAGLIGNRGTLSRLLFSRQEADDILAAAPTEESMEALDFQASRATAISAELAQYRIVHFATHGLLDSEHPELSCIVLSQVDQQGNQQDGYLRLYEVYNLNLPAELVVLSACQTGLGKQIKGEGLVGLTRGFMYAGANRVVASLWKVDDRSTAELMKYFYQAMLTEGKRPAEALRAAQVKMREQGEWASPYHWAGFVLQGEWK